MSLNRSEQRIFDYLQSQVDERHFWIGKVQKTLRGAGENPDEAVRSLEKALWDYHVERSAVARPLRDAVQAEGLQRTSMKNLAELLLRLWVEPKPQPKKASGGR
ncbi:MAG: hypothetical protein ABIZ81_09285 [Opitutaceae bacterium]